MALNLLIYCTRGYSRRILCHTVSNQRFLNTNIKQYGQSFHKNDDSEKRKRAKLYILHRVMDYFQNYEVHLAKRFPKAMLTYKVFMEGVHQFFKDLKNFVKVMRIVYTTSYPLNNLTRKELELYHQMPKDVAKVAPTLILSLIPFSLYAILPLVYLYPRQLLTSHFWTLQQKSEFKTMILKNRLMHNRPVFRHLQSHLKLFENQSLYNEWSMILGQLGSGVQPTVHQILECQGLFACSPYSLDSLNRNHIMHLAKLHEINPFFRRGGLVQKTIVLQAMDRAIMREGGVHNMPVENLKTACYVRGLNPTNMKNEDMICWLNDWITVSKEVDDETMSLLLHCPILLGYNQPSNWALIYPYRE